MLGLFNRFKPKRAVEITRAEDEAVHIALARLQKALIPIAAKMQLAIPFASGVKICVKAEVDQDGTPSHFMFVGMAEIGGVTTMGVHEDLTTAYARIIDAARNEGTYQKLMITPNGLTDDDGQPFEEAELPGLVAPAAV